MKFRHALLSVLATLSVAQPAAAVNLVQNGSFENQVVTANAGTWQVFTSLPGWSVSNGYIELQRNGLFGTDPVQSAPDGQQWAELDYPGIGAQISQTITTTPGTDYVLSFSYTPRPGFGDQALGIFWNGSLVYQVGGTPTDDLLDWSHYQLTLSASSGTSTLGFGSIANYADAFMAGGNLLDNVSLVAKNAEVPEPASCLLLMGGCGFLARRRMRAQAN